MKTKIDLKSIAICRKGLQVERMHTVQHLTPYSNGFHSANAAIIVMHLCNQNEASISIEACVCYMLMHDVAEYYVGDVPANVKVDNPELKNILSRIEGEWEFRNIPHLPDLTVFEKSMCKVADLVELGMFCVDELNMGNTNVLFALDNVILYLRNYTNINGCDDLASFLVKQRTGR